MTSYYLKDANGNQFPVQSTPIGAQISASSLCVTPATDALAEPGGAAIAGATLPSGGLGLTGWLSAVWKVLSGTLSVSWSGQSVGVSSLPSLPAGSNAIGSVAVSNLPATQAVSAAALPLPSGASTDAHLTNVQSAPGVAQTVAVTVQGNASGVPLPSNLFVGGAVASSANPVPILDAYQASVSASWTAATTVNTALTLNTAGYDTVIFTIAAPAGLTAGVVSFEVYDGVNWVVLKAPRTDSYLTDNNFVLSGSPGTKSWQLPVAGYPQTRARLSAAITGAGTVGVVGIASSVPDVSLVTVGIDPNSTLPGFASVPTVSDSQSAPFAGAVAMTVGSTYASGRTIEVDCTVAGNVVFQFPDGTTRTRAVVIGTQTFPYACTQIVSSGTTATASFYNMK